MSTLTVPVRDAALARNGFLKRYFYFVMSLVLAAIVVTGFQRTVNEHLFHPAVPRPFILWMHGAAFTGWIAFYFSIDAGARAQSQLAPLYWMVWRWAGYGDGSAGGYDFHHHGAV